MFSGGVVLREGWMQTTSWSQPGAPGLGLGGDTGGAQGAAQSGASGGGRKRCSGDRTTSTRSASGCGRHTEVLKSKTQEDEDIRMRFTSVLPLDVSVE